MLGFHAKAEPCSWSKGGTLPLLTLKTKFQTFLNVVKNLLNPIVNAVTAMATTRYVAVFQAIGRKQ